MIHLLKNLLREPLPPHVHFHVDDDGNDVWCDESVCRPARHARDAWPLAYPPPR